MNNRIYLYLFLFILSILVFFSNGHYGGDGLENYLTAESIVLDRDLTIHDRAFGIKEIRYETRGMVDSKGGYRSAYGIGMPILLVPLYALGNLISKFIPQVPHDYLTQFTVSLANPIIITLTALVLFIFLGELKFSARTSFLTAICYSFCTMSFIYARSGFSDPAVGLFILLGMLLIYKYETTRINRYLLFAVFCIGYTILLKKNSFLYLPILAMYLVYKGLRAKSPKAFIKLLLTVTIPTLFFILLYFLFQNAGMSDKYASSQKTFVGLVRDGTVLGCQMFKGLYYYFLSPGKGFFLYNLPLILALFAIKDFTKKRKEIALYIIIFIFINVLYYSLKFTRGTLFSWGPRYLYPLIPLMCIPLAEFIENSKKVFKKAAVIMLCIAGFIIQIPCLFINFSNYIFFVKDKLFLQEYLINFMPELSPIMGAWWLFISAVKRTFGGVSLNFTYSPDIQFLEPITRSLNGYDVWDIWWVNAPKVSPSILPVVITILLSLLFVSVTCAIKLKQSLSNNR